jgi:hypothetical protein
VEDRTTATAGINAPDAIVGTTAGDGNRGTEAVDGTSADDAPGAIGFCVEGEWEGPVLATGGGPCGGYCDGVIEHAAAH